MDRPATHRYIRGPVFRGSMQDDEAALMNILQVVEVLWLHTPYLLNLGTFATWR